MCQQQCLCLSFAIPKSIGNKRYAINSVNYSKKCRYIFVFNFTQTRKHCFQFDSILNWMQVAKHGSLSGLSSLLMRFFTSIFLDIWLLKMKWAHGLETLFNKHAVAEQNILEEWRYQLHIQGDSGGICNTLGNDSMCDSKHKSSYENGSDFEWLPRYGEKKIRTILRARTAIT